MNEIMRKEYWSKSEAFLLPLTGIQRIEKFPVKTYLFWENYDIEHYLLIMMLSYKNKVEFDKFCRKELFPYFDKGNYLIETHDVSDNTVIFILDIGEWALDVEMFLKGRYSRFSSDAKDLIMDYHTYYDKGPKIRVEILSALEPNKKFRILDPDLPNGINGLEYISRVYDIPYETLEDLGEACAIYDKDKETLTDISSHIENEVYNL